MLIVTNKEEVKHIFYGLHEHYHSTEKSLRAEIEWENRSDVVSDIRNRLEFIDSLMNRVKEIYHTMPVDIPA